MEKAWHAKMYLRLSVDDGDKDESNSIKNQRRIIEEYVHNKKDIILTGERVDDGCSGTNFERQGFKKLMEDIQLGEVNCVIVKDLSRFGRNYIETGNYLERIFPAMGVRFIAVNDYIDSGLKQNYGDSIIIPFKNLMNDSYSRDISIKIRSNLDAKRRRGEFIGAFAPYGYKKDSENKNHLIVDEYASQIVKNIFNWRMWGISPTCIAEKLSSMAILTPTAYRKLHEIESMGIESGESFCWSPSEIYDILQNEAYIGNMVQGKKEMPSHKIKKYRRKDPSNWFAVENTHEEIISKRDFDMVNKLMNKRTRTTPGGKCEYPLSGFLYCADCGEIMVRRKVTSKGKTYVYYICKNSKTGKCTSHMIKEKAIEKAVYNAVRQYAVFWCNIKRLCEGLDQLESALEINIREKRKKEIEIYSNNLRKNRLELIALTMGLSRDIESGLLNEYEAEQLRDYYNGQIIRLEKILFSIKNEKDSFEKRNECKRNWLLDFMAKGCGGELTRALLISTVDEIWVYSKNAIKINFVYGDSLEFNQKGMRQYAKG